MQLVRFLEYPEIELSNNSAENLMRPAVWGRKNWTHDGSVEAGPKVVAISSVMEGCRRMGAGVSVRCAPGVVDRKVSEVEELYSGPRKLDSKLIFS